MMTIELANENFFLSISKVAPADLGDLYPEEIQILKARHLPAWQNLEFYHGRKNARAALEKFGFFTPVLSDENGAPLFPKEIVGSISHTKEYACAITAPSSLYQSIAIDVESMGRMDKSMYDALFTREECVFLEAIDEQEKYATLLYSLKECLFKIIPRDSVNEAFDLRSIHIDLRSKAVHLSHTTYKLEQYNWHCFVYQNHLVTIFWEFKTCFEKSPSEVAHLANPL